MVRSFEKCLFIEFKIVLNLKGKNVEFIKILSFFLDSLKFRGVRWFFSDFFVISLVVLELDGFLGFYFKVVIFLFYK